MNIEKEKIEKYVDSIVRKYSNRGVSNDELFDVGMKAAMRVLDENKDNPKFNMITDYRFNWFIRQAITRKIIDGIDNKISVYDVELINKYFKYLRNYKVENNGDEPSDEKIINSLEIDNEKLKSIRDIINEYDL